MNDMSNFKFKLNSSGVREFLQSAPVQTMLENKARAIQQRVGDGYEVSTYVGKTRANASVRANTVKSIKDNKKNNTLLKAVR